MVVVVVVSSRGSIMYEIVVVVVAVYVCMVVLVVVEVVVVVVVVVVVIMLACMYYIYIDYIYCVFYLYSMIYTVWAWILYLLSYISPVFYLTAAGDNVDFTELTKVAVGIINKLDHCQRGISSMDSRVSGFEREVKTAVATAEKSPAQDNTNTSSTAAIQNNTNTTSTSTSSTTAAASSNNNSTNKKAGVNYSLKDLTALRRRQSETGTQFTSRGDDDASTVDSRTLNTTNSNHNNKSNTPTSTTALNTTSRLNNNKSSEGGDELPLGWVEKIDKASGRKYYVNQ